MCFVQFTEIRDVTARYDTLVTTHKVQHVLSFCVLWGSTFLMSLKDLMETDHTNQDAVDAERTHLLKLTEVETGDSLHQKV